ncbi:MAG: 2-hydroxyglutaryl-CoA dehydratase, partial [Negativicutes bacterium]|nr:2-hydroxyglutaryl-CoA dehydratase [Negativicutes bacterium]
VYRTRPYEQVAGATGQLQAYWRQLAVDWLGGNGGGGFTGLVSGMVRDFECLPIDADRRRPRVGIVGEILVKYHPGGNNRLAEWLESEGAEVAASDMAEFFLYCAYDGTVKYRLLGGSWWEMAVGRLFIQLVEYYRDKVRRALAGSRRFSLPGRLADLVELAQKHVGLGHISGEGWLLTAEILEFLQAGVENVVCVQPFGCLPNHITGKGMMKELRRRYPQLNIAAIDYDPGASEANQINRLKLLLAVASERLKCG